LSIPYSDWRIQLLSEDSLKLFPSIHKSCESDFSKFIGLWNGMKLHRFFSFLSEILQPKCSVPKWAKVGNAQRSFALKII
jgi:hypothetical protein